MKILKYLSILGLSVVIWGCSSHKQVEALMVQPTEFERMSGWSQADTDRALQAFKRSCDRWMAHPQSLPKKLAAIDLDPSHWWKVCFEAVEARDGRAFFQRYFRPYRLTTNLKKTGLLTGYYEPLLEGSLQRDAEYRYPVWAKPHGFAQGQPMPNRQQIDESGLHGKAEVLLWAKDPVDLFFMHIQGSGRVRLPDGTEKAIGFASKNGHGYRSIGKYLIEHYGVERDGLSMQALKRWLRAHPQHLQDVLWHNPSYIFFQWLPGKDGPVGAQGVPLTAEASLAVDPGFISYGMPLWLETELPATSQTRAEPYQQLVIAQDTGSAIKGGLRGDLFFGAGERAEWLAGHMKQPADFYALIPYY